MRVALAAIALGSLLGFATLAQAGILASPPVYGGAPGVGGAFTCRIFNAGTTPVTITVRHVIIPPGIVIPLSSDTCNVPLGGGKYCAFASGVANISYMCEAVTTVSAVNLRGIGEVQTSAHAIVTAEPMR